MGRAGKLVLVLIGLLVGAAGTAGIAVPRYFEAKGLSVVEEAYVRKLARASQRVPELEAIVVGKRQDIAPQGQRIRDLQARMAKLQAELATTKKDLKTAQGQVARLKREAAARPLGFQRLGDNVPPAPAATPADPYADIFRQPAAAPPAPGWLFSSSVVSGDIVAASDDELFIVELRNGETLKLQAKTYCFGFYEGDVVRVSVEGVQATMFKSDRVCEAWIE